MNKCFIVKTGALTWLGANAACYNSFGGQLAIPFSASENAQLSSMISSIGNAWIGFNDIHIEGLWRAINGTTLNYSNWSKF